MTDSIADMLTRIRNASLIRRKEVVLPYSGVKSAIASILVREGYLEKAEEVKEKVPQLILTLKYDNRQPAIHHLRRVSKPGHRHYVKHGDLKNVLNGFGLSILSTPKGIMTDAEARKEKIGGELICEVY